MFKPGDKVICIDDTLTAQIIRQIKINSTYTIKSTDVVFGCVSLFDYTGIYMSKRFIPLKEYRKSKLEKLCLNQEIK